MLTTQLFNNPTLPQLQWGAVIGACLVAAAWDLRTRRIPNWLCASLFISGIIASVARGGCEGAVDAACGCVLLALPYILLFAFAGGGAGDAKLMGAAGVWLGLDNAVWTLLAVSLSGAALGLMLAVYRKQLRAVAANMATIAMSGGMILFGRVKVADARSVLPAEQKMLAMPYGLAIFLGVCLAAAGRLVWHF
jgi:prepilin peptidase CpaA